MHRNYKIQTFHFQSNNNQNRNKSADSKNESFKNVKSVRKEETLNMRFYNYLQRYEIVQENGRIIRRITNPKRDGIIQRSIEGVSTRSKPGTSGQQRMRSEHRKRANLTAFSQRKGENQKKLFREQGKSTHWQLKGKSNPFLEASATMSPQILRSKNTNSTEFISSHTNSQHVLKSAHSVQNLAKQRVPVANFKTYYGFGSTILCLRNIRINLIPQLKAEDLLYMQLLVKGGSKKLYTTKLISYENLSKVDIKFALRIKKVGEFIPLRVLKVNGVDAVELGIVDLQLSRFLYEEEQLSKWYQQSENTMPLQDSDDGKHILVNDSGKTKLIVKSVVDCKFRRNKVEEAQGGITLEYLVYRKKYT